MHCGSFSDKGTRLAHRIKGPMEGGRIYHKILDENILLTPSRSQAADMPRPYGATILCQTISVIMETLS